MGIVREQPKISKRRTLQLAIVDGGAERKHGFILRANSRFPMAR